MSWLVGTVFQWNMFFFLVFFGLPMELFGVAKMFSWSLSFETVCWNSFLFLKWRVLCLYHYIMFVWRKATTDHCCSRLSRQVRKAMNRPWLPAETLLEQSELYRSRMSSAPSDFFSIDNEPLGCMLLMNCNGRWGLCSEREREREEDTGCMVVVVDDRFGTPLVKIC